MPLVLGEVQEHSRLQRGLVQKMLRLAAVFDPRAVGGLDVDALLGVMVRGHGAVLGAVKAEAHVHAVRHDGAVRADGVGDAAAGQRADGQLFSFHLIHENSPY